MKLWGGRFSKDVDDRVNDFNSSISFDGRMYREDIEGSIAHATMLGECGIISTEEAIALCAELSHLLKEIENGTVELTADAEDIHMNIETLLTQRLGDAGKRLHTARSRNDQVALDIRLYLRGQIVEIRGLVLKLEQVLVNKASQHLRTIMPGYTHLQRAQPTTLAHYLLAYAQMFRRDVTRLEDCLERMDEMPLGAGALCGTTYPIDRKRTAQLLGFSAVTANSMDSVSDRDFVIELASDISLIMMHLSRFSEEIILWCSSEFGFLELDDAYATGSSIMPQKKNPDVAELVRGKTGRVYGDLMALLTVMKGLPLAYNKDMQEDKEAIFDAVDTVKISLEVFTAMLDTCRVREERMRASVSAGHLNATDCADYLVRKGLPFRDAYRVVGGLIRLCGEKGTDLEHLTLDQYRMASPLFDEDIYQAIDPAVCVNERRSEGGPAPESTQKQIEILRAFLEERKETL
ncbi:MAG: argininosuccinate lyase [Clostridia bacterium]|nr:argininosuccinate lyase [Clostridia bacterium]